MTGRFSLRWQMVLIWAAIVAAAWLPLQSGSAAPRVTVTSTGPGKQPFIHIVMVHLDDLNSLDQVRFTVRPKPGSATRPISARYARAYLRRRGYLDSATKAITVPVFGLYAGYANNVELMFTFVDGTHQAIDLKLPSPPYASGIFARPAIIEQARLAVTPLSYDFMELKSFFNPHSPTIIDTDGELRWVGTSNTLSMQSIFYDNSFFVVGNSQRGAAGAGTAILRNEFDGTVTTVADYAADNVTTFHHNFDFGKTGILTCVTTPEYLESTVMEVGVRGRVLHTWNLAQIISAAMVAGGDDPSLFVAASGSLFDWFHNNSNAYRASDNSLVVSSRENFVIALDYETGAIKWIIGDPTKQWYGFPSLRKYALEATPGTHYPLGQHAVSFFQDKLLLFDDGDNSADHTPKGESRSYSAPRKYVVDQAAGTFTEVWNYLATPSLYSPITSSVYEDKPGDYLIDYSVVGPYEYAELIGLDPLGAKVFDYKYTEVRSAATAWNAVPIHLENLVFE